MHIQDFAVSPRVVEANCLHAKTMSHLPGLPYLPRRDNSPPRVVSPTRVVSTTSCKRLIEFFKQTRPSLRVHWVACGTCSVPGNFFQVGACSQYNERSDCLIVTGPRADYGLAKTKQKVIKKTYNKLLTNRASSSRSGEYWPWVVFVRTSLRSVRTVTTSGQYFPGSTALALG